jgi:hypothetical protein
MQKTVALTRRVVQALPLIRKFVVAIGIGLVLASLRFDIWTIRQNLGVNYWSSTRAQVLLLALVALCSVLLIANVWLEEEERFMPSIGALGAILLGFFLVPVISDWEDMLIGPKLGVAGAALIALGGLPAQSFRFRERSLKRPALPVLLAWLLTAIGAALTIVALPRAASSFPLAGPNSSGLFGPFPTYWKSVGFVSGGHALGICMLVVAVAAIVAAIGGVVLKIPALGRWALGASLLLLGLALWYPAYGIGRDLSALATGSGLALEGSLLAVAAALVARAVERGALTPEVLDLRLLVAVVGIGLALAGLWTNVFSQFTASSFWTDGTASSLMLVLVAAAGALVALGLAYRRTRLAMIIVSAIGWLLAGLFGWYVANRAPDHLNGLDLAPWLGLAGGVLMGVSSVIPGTLKHRRWRRSAGPTPRRLAVSLITGVGAALAAVSLWLDAEPTETTESLFTAAFGQSLPKGVENQTFHSSYWSTPAPTRTGIVGTDHSLGIVMLVLAVLALVALVATLISRLSALRAWVLAASLALLGIALFVPAEEAFHHFGSLRIGAWLVLVGALIASAGAVFLALSDLPPEDAKEESKAAREKRSRAPRTGRQRRVPETRRA